MTVWLLILVGSVAAYAQTAPSPASDETEIRAVVSQYFDAYARKDIAALLALWSASAPNRAARRASFERTFATTDQFTFSAPAITRLKVTGNQAEVWATAERRATSVDGQSRQRGPMRLRFQFIKGADGWRLLSDAPAVSALVNELAAVTSDADRERLLAEGATLIGSEQRELLFVLIGQSDNAYTRSDFNAALNLLLAARVVAERLSDRRELANIWQNTAIVHFVARRYPQALAAYEQALKLNEELGRQVEAARQLTSIALVHAALGKPDLALQFFARGLALFEELGELNDAAQALDNIGNVHYERGDYAEAFKFYERSLAQFEAARAASSAARQALKLGRTAYELGDDRRAIALYETAAEKFDRLGASANRGVALHNIANLYYAEGDYARALGYYERARAAAEAADNKPGAIAALQGAGLIHTIHGDHAQALATYEQHLKLAETMGDPAEKATAHQELGGARYALGQLPEALVDFRASLSLRELLGDKPLWAAAHLDVGIVLAAQREFAAAVAAYEQGRALYASVGYAPGVATALLNLSAVRFTEQDFARALSLADEAAPIAKGAGELDLFWQARYRAGKAHFKRADLKAAHAALAEAVAVVESLRGRPNRNALGRYQENRIAPYLAMIDLLIAEGQGGAAFDFTERARAHGLRALLGTTRLRIDKGLSAAERAREAQLVGAAASLTTQAAREAEKSQPNQTRLADLKRRAEAARSVHTAFRQQLFKLHPRLQALRGEASPLDTRQVALLARAPRTAWLSFVETEEQLYLFAFTGGRAGQSKEAVQSRRWPLRIYVLGASRDEAAARVANLRELIARRNEDWKPGARELYDVLIKPAEAQLTGTEHLVIAPDGWLWNLPFEALLDANNQPLLARYSLARVPSLSALGIAALRPTAARAPALLLVERPTLSPQTAARVNAMAPAAAAVAADAQTETALLHSQVYGASQTLRLTGAEASETRVKAEAGRFGVVHLTARGLLSEASPWLSAVALAAVEGDGNDGLLELRELLQLDLRAWLMILPECEAVRPQTSSARSLTALGWTARIAGVPAMLVNGWPVDAAQRDELLLAFHRALPVGGAQPVTIVWQRTVKEWLARGAFAHPYFWAGFQLLGDGR